MKFVGWRRSLVGLMAGAALMTPCVSGCRSMSAPDRVPDPDASAAYEIRPGERVGALTATADIATLRRVYGAEQTQSGSFYVGEGMCVAATVLFPDDPSRRLEILWGDGRRQAFPVAAQLYGDGSSRWVTPEGVTLGTTAADLTRLNGGPFAFSGFGWDYGGRILSWQGGRLEKSYAALLLTLSPTTELPAELPVYGEQRVSSRVLSEGQRRQIAVRAMTAFFPQNQRRFPQADQAQQPCEELNPHREKTQNRKD